jgi:hypothetical protein
MSPAGNWSEENSGKFWDQLVTTYVGGSVALECAVVDLHGAVRNINSAALKVACPPPGHGRKIRKNLETVTLPLTLLAVLVSKIESRMTRVARPKNVSVRRPCHESLVM